MKVNGLGGVFIKAQNPDKLYRWYEENFGFARNESGDGFLISSDHLSADFKVAFSSSPSIMNFQVPNLAQFLTSLAEKGVRIDDHIEETSYGIVAWVFDPEGNKIELWEPRPYKENIIVNPEPD
ncbi:VOC family protein [Bdellovibrio sp. 22V]|uniref:VOC family protein n=1 Tax=Bdellovibrio TaxID=958 RepID=UPI002543EEDD|nr:VOC family protein [Bdellovibrio sp. 22V]WII71531.1 VOC family protein [Bdellovibrio sp. 22V]